MLTSDSQAVGASIVLSMKRLCKKKVERGKEEISR
jgi:hypothetical protein